MILWFSKNHLPNFGADNSASVSNDDQTVEIAKSDRA
jgi:hypothetical protein